MDKVRSVPGSKGTAAGKGDAISEEATLGRARAEWEAVEAQEWVGMVETTSPASKLPGPGSYTWSS